MSDKLHLRQFRCWLCDRSFGFSIFRQQSSVHHIGENMTIHDGMELLGRWAHAGNFPAESAHSDTTATHGVERLNTKLAAARAIRQLRVRARLTQEQLATHFGLTVSEMIAVEIGEADCLLILQISERMRNMVGDHAKQVNLAILPIA